MKINRGLLIYGLVMAGLVTFAIRYKPSAERVRADVHRSIAAYAAERAGDQPGAPAGGKNASLVISKEESRDWILARSHSAAYAGERFFCFAVGGLTICSGPDE